MSKRVLSAAAIVCFAATAGHAGILDPNVDVAYTLEIDQQNGTFEIYGEVVNDGSNLGLSSYGLPLTGSITSAESMGPTSTFGTISFNPFSISEEGDIGFTEFNDAMTVFDGSWIIRGFQKTTTAEPGVIFGVGQRAGTLADDLASLQNGGHADSSYQLISSVQPSYDARVLLGNGTWDTTGDAPSWFLGRPNDLVALVWDPAATQTNHLQNIVPSSGDNARVEIQTVFVGNEIPEPTSASLLALGGLLVGLRRRGAA